MPTKTPAFAVVRLDDYFTDIKDQITVVKVLMDLDVARAEAERLNALKRRSRYWVLTTRLVTSE